MARRGSLILLDTHIAVWLYAGLTEKLTPAATHAIEESDLQLPQMARLELQYLREIGRIKTSSRTITDSLRRSIGLRISDGSIDEIARESLMQDWTLDVFDRMIVSEAKVRQLPLVTADRRIQGHYPGSVW